MTLMYFIYTRNRIEKMLHLSCHFSKPKDFRIFLLWFQCDQNEYLKMIWFVVLNASHLSKSINNTWRAMIVA